MGNCKITFHPGGQEAVVSEGTDLLAAAIAVGAQIPNSCGGKGACGECKVVVREGKVVTESSRWLTEEEIKTGYVLACRTTVVGDMQVEIPAESRLEGGKILTETRGDERLADFSSKPEDVVEGIVPEGRALFTPSAMTTKRFLRLPSPTIDDNISDLDRLYREIRQWRNIPQLHIDLASIRRLGGLLRESNWQVTVTIGQRNGITEVIQIESGDTSRRNYGIAADIGTTTVVASLIDLNNGSVLGTKAAHNRQILYGPDVITRIVYAEKEGGLGVLHRAVVDTLNDLISAQATEHRIQLNDVTALVLAGNTTMTHLLLQVDPRHLRRDPYVPTTNFASVIQAVESGIKINPRGWVACMPGVSSYVGGDITSGVLASGIEEMAQPAMLIDLGTNGEIVLGNREWMVCCSASAGTAFEGRGARCGPRSVQGVRIDDRNYEVVCTTTGDTTPVGICGSGYIDALAELLRTGIVDRQGAIRPGITPRARQHNGTSEFVMVWAKESGTSRDIVIPQPVIDNLIRAKGAIYSGAKVLAGQVGLTLQDIDKIYIGGGFGNYLNIEKAIWIGLLPDLPPERFEFIGNSSIAGAKLALLSQEAMREADEIAGRMTNIELCAEPSYMGEYVSSLFLPHTDINLFPSVKQLLGI